jgi:hypothetical protein
MPRLGDMGRQAVEFFADVRLGGHHNRFLVQAVGIEALGLLKKRRDLFGKARTDRIRLASRRFIGALRQRRYFIETR